jgi:hypothetical protein
MLCASDFKVHLPIHRFTVLPLGDHVPDGQSACGSALHIPARANSLQPLSKGSDRYGLFDQIAGEMYVIWTLRGELNGMVRRLYPVRRLGL